PGGSARDRSPGEWLWGGGTRSVRVWATLVKAPQPTQRGRRPLPRRYYVDPGIYAEEQERVFAQRWVCVGRAAELAASGDYVLRSIAGESVIVVLGTDGAVRALLDVSYTRET